MFDVWLLFRKLTELLSGRRLQCDKAGSFSDSCMFITLSCESFSLSFQIWPSPGILFTNVSKSSGFWCWKAQRMFFLASASGNSFSLSLSPPTSPPWIMFCGVEKSLATKRYNYTSICPYCHPSWAADNHAVWVWSCYFIMSNSLRGDVKWL